MQIKHNDTLIASIGEVLSSAQVAHFLTANEINLPLDEITFEYSQGEALEARRTAYIVESDPLFMEWQYDQTDTSKQAWLDKVAEIKARYPFPA
ncbi:hypothetical protein [Pseudoalteromonas luteoviolacea]|uniref:Uncharacterized protein n=1 Tax=Pseudoalteromonas luteoviolacea S4054 TaxID=1129367 RepID=A0A0F6A776_9GAMM|nr:hypothetical protein [Pseudoalteromonas luteoviolacea]AOT09344.1 hypothetical protein S4054249_16470 [Pseudoalteromonas luteoviolacea]AOT14256.1 hypothetical protein S40542_16440 [Pseudoalteromonas luteoviolacea]AOT19172.1 hypothetical protein S4054_16445 [Pseudoalteromonas luteoviolacea]KKE82077.1 hypothetical protein N479_19805 [Pseudoalteromonas luteoviolacea S4054]KZN73412.1 hypothetical protein N481_12040 [Pseudoalteromonas luteoviolacea S4047-1]